MYIRANVHVYRHTNRYVYNTLWQCITVLYFWKSAYICSYTKDVCPNASKLPNACFFFPECVEECIFVCLLYLYRYYRYQHFKEHWLLKKWSIITDAAQTFANKDSEKLDKSIKKEVYTSHIIMNFYNKLMQCEAVPFNSYLSACNKWSIIDFLSFLIS